LTLRIIRAHQKRNAP